MATSGEVCAHELWSDHDHDHECVAYAVRITIAQPPADRSLRSTLVAAYHVLCTIVHHTYYIVRTSYGMPIVYYVEVTNARQLGYYGYDIYLITIATALKHSILCRSNKHRIRNTCYSGSSSKCEEMDRISLYWIVSNHACRELVAAGHQRLR